MADETATADEPTPARALNHLFLAAKEKDEFEYVCALLRIRGMEDPGWDRLEETATLVREMLSLISTPLLPHTRIRLGLLVYCHLVEADSIYEVIANMLHTVEGERVSIDPFHDLYRRKRPSDNHPSGQTIPPSAKLVVRHLCDHAHRVGQGAVAELLEWMFNDDVRNAFFHGDYILYQDQFRSRGAGLSLTLEAVGDVINRGLAFYDGFMSVWQEHRHSYKEPRVVQGRFRSDGGLMPLRLLVHPTQGVYGFTSDLGRAE